MGQPTMLTQAVQIKMEMWKINAEGGRGNDKHTVQCFISYPKLYIQIDISEIYLVCSYTRDILIFLC